MANSEHLKFLMQGAKAWNKWREDNRKVMPDLSETDLDGRDLVGANFSNADLTQVKLNNAILRDTDLFAARLWNAQLYGADLSPSNLGHANLYKANLNKARLCGALFDNESILTKAHLREAKLNNAQLNGTDLSEADLSEADLSNAYFIGANLTGASLVKAVLIETNLEKSILDKCKIFGIAAWNLNLKGATQINLILSKEHDEHTITTDYLELAQILHLFLKNDKIRDILNATTSKLILILGRFIPERKAVLDKIHDGLRAQNYVPVLFDWKKPDERDLIETVTTLARLARFIIVDITDAACVRSELQTIVPALPSVPVQPILQKPNGVYSEFEHLTRFPWVLKVHGYDAPDDLLASLPKKIIKSAEKKAKELQRK